MIQNPSNLHNRAAQLREALKTRVLALDGSTGVMFQRMGLSEGAVRSRRFLTHTRPLAANFDILCLSRPDLVAEVHRKYLEAGADIIETNTFNANALSQREYATEHLVLEINRAGAGIARREADAASTPDKPRFVAGAIGPTALSASLPVDVDDPACRAVDFDTLADAYTLQSKGLIEGGADFLLIETAFDLLNAKVAATGARRAMNELGVEIPLVFSFTISDASGRLLSGHTPDAILTTIAPFGPLAVGFNCSAGPEGLSQAVRDLASKSPFPVIFYPNAGLPDRMGHYSLTPADFAAAMRPLLSDGILNIAGGCCGTTPEYIAALETEINSPQTQVHIPSASIGSLPWLAGLDAFDDRRGFINVGERCNVAGSRKFLRLIKEGNFDEALAIARKQVDDGAMMLDINMDDGMLDSRAEMTRFLRVLASDPATSSLPWMIDSSDFATIEEALKNISGRAVVNSISLKHGEEEFMRQARIIRSYGAAVVVMLFDEEGQATTFERKIAVAQRACRILMEKCGFSPRDIVIDPNVLTIATGMPEHDAYAIDFIRAVEWINTNLPGVKTSGGVSNLSFAFRGNNYLRQAMHAVFLYHAIRAGLSMAIVDPGTKVQYADIAPEHLRLIEDAILMRHPAAGECLATAAQSISGDPIVEKNISPASPSGETPEERIILALQRGDDSCLAADLPLAVERAGSANAVVENTLMKGMENIGALFESGKMFLPQVVKSARTMHRAVELLRPLLESTAEKGSSKGSVVLATVKGDVHDIGKNIAAVVLRCNNFNVIDLGVQVEASAIINAVKEHNPVFVGLSGLISPSLEEMARTLDAMRREGITVPVLVGGAATSELHTALMLAPAYGPEGLVVRVADASQDPIVASRLLRDFSAEKNALQKRQNEIADEYNRSQASTVISAAEPTKGWDENTVKAPTFTGVRTLQPVSVAEVAPYINWTYFFHTWKVRANSPEADELLADAKKIISELATKSAVMLCQVAFYPAKGTTDCIVTPLAEIPTPRQKPSDERTHTLSLADFIAPEHDYIGCFAVTIGPEIRKELESDTDKYHRLLLQSVADRLAEATSEWLHRCVRTDLWGYAPDEPLDFNAIRRGKYRGIRPAVGYPSLPDQRLMHTLMQHLRPEEIDLTVTANGALSPASSIAGFYLASPHARYFSL